MKLTILGGGGFRVPMIFDALSRDATEPLIDEIRLYDPSGDRLGVISGVLRQMNAVRPGPAVRCSTDLGSALDGAHFVFSAVRVGGLQGRIRDERSALSLGVLGQETTGPGGIAYGLRTIPVALDIAARVARHAPSAYVMNFTNPAGMITEAMRSVLGSRVIGICDTPSGLVKRITALFGADPGLVRADYVGLNHLGWLRGVSWGDRDLVADLLADDTVLGAVEEGRVFGIRWLQTLGCIPNEYLYYYYFNRDAVRSLLDSGRTRGEFLHEQQSAFYARAQREPRSALRLWLAARNEREATYMTEARPAGEERPDLSGGGYERVALDLMRAIARNEDTTMILNVGNGSAVPGLPSDAVVEVPCHVDAGGVTPLKVPEPGGHQIGLMQQMKAVERLTIDAAVEGRPDLALKALALHPLVDSVNVARDLLAAYRRAEPGLFSGTG